MNLFAIILGAFINIIIGSLWYSSALFVKPWLQSIGKTEKELRKKGTGVLYGTTSLMALIKSYILLYLITILNITNPVDGAALGFLLWFGFIVTATAPDYIFAGRPTKLFVINMSYHLVTLVIVGSVFALWH